MLVYPPVPPEKCQYCHSDVAFVNNSALYGRSYGHWPWMYLCRNRSCWASVGVHKGTDTPLGTMANSTLRRWRKESKTEFLKYCAMVRFTRKESYTHLAEMLCISRELAHFGMFDLEMCRLAKAIYLELNENIG